MEFNLDFFHYSFHHTFDFLLEEYKIEISIKVKTDRSISFFGKILSPNIKFDGNIRQEISFICQKYKNKELEQLLILWERYDSNKIHYGTPNQEEILLKYSEKGLELNDENIDILKRFGIYTDIYNKEKITYGKNILEWKISEKDLELLQSFV